MHTYIARETKYFLLPVYEPFGKLQRVSLCLNVALRPDSGNCYLNCFLMATVHLLFHSQKRPCFLNLTWLWYI